MVYIIMGVSGSGKTTIGQLLAQKLALPFYDGDDFHSSSNISKMKHGIPLTDEDREGWLKTLAKNIPLWQSQGGAVLACSALKEKYRVILRSGEAKEIEWILLKGSEELIRQRISKRKDHFMNARLLHSQFEILEEPDYGIKVSVDDEPEKVVGKIMSQIAKKL
jgi:carbohydrate kinase (thermoresistant glucokinase family)